MPTPPSRSGRTPGSRRSRPGGRRSRTRCRTRATSRTASMQTDSGQATYPEAVARALAREMDRDPDVFIIGEGAGQFGGSIKVTKVFLAKFGPRRVVDT